MSAELWTRADAPQPGRPILRDEPPSATDSQWRQPAGPDDAPPHAFAPQSRLGRALGRLNILRRLA
jgi:hypothetical protein